MTWANFYLICFAVGFLLSAISFVAGGLRLHLHLHLPVIKISFTRLGVFVALTFIGLPFVVRTIQPVLEDFDPELEDAAASLGEYLAGEIDDDGHVGLDLYLDAYDAPEGAVHRQVYGPPAAPSARGAFGYLVYQAYLYEARYLIGYGGFIEAEPLRYAHAADTRILPDRPDYTGRRIRSYPAPSRHLNPFAI